MLILASEFLYSFICWMSTGCLLIPVSGHHLLSIPFIITPDRQEAIWCFFVAGDECFAIWRYIVYRWTLIIHMIFEIYCTVCQKKQHLTYSPFVELWKGGILESCWCGIRFHIRFFEFISPVYLILFWSIVANLILYYLDVWTRCSPICPSQGNTIQFSGLPTVSKWLHQLASCLRFFYSLMI